MSGIKFTNQIKMLTPPTEPEHVARKGDVEPVLLTEAALAALESPPDSGLYPTLKSKEVVTTDHSIDTVGIFPYPDLSVAGQALFTESPTPTNFQDEVTIPADGYISYGTTVSITTAATPGNGSAFNALLDNVLLGRFDLGSLRAMDGSVINGAFSLVGHAYVRAGQKFKFYTDITAASWSTIWSRDCTFYPLLFKKVLPNKVIVSPGSSYSTDEIATLDTWVDGKTIYKKTGIVNSPAAPGNVTDTLFTTTALDRIVKYEVVNYNGGNSHGGPAYYGTNGELRWVVSVYIAQNTTSVRYNLKLIDTAYANLPFYVTVYYTKM